MNIVLRAFSRLLRMRLKPASPLLVLAAFVAGVAHSAESPQVPRLFFKYSRLYDGVCSSPTPILEEWASETRARTPELAAIWEAEGPILFGKLFESFPLGFSRGELSATLTVCPSSPSMSDPLILNILPHLRSYVGARPVWPDYAFSDLVFHELLHTWLVEHRPAVTPLLTKYAAEPPPLLAHLHLMALQKHVYTQLGRTEMLAWISAQYPRMRGVYPRAWQIVNEIEGYEAFIAELGGR